MVHKNRVRRPTSFRGMILATRLPMPGSPLHGGSSLLSPPVYAELQRVARGYLGGGSPHHTLQPTALVHEAYLRLASHPPQAWADRQHFIASIARVMRQVLVNHALAKRTRKREAPGERVALDVAVDSYEHSAIDLVVLHEALETLERLDPRQARIVDLRFFGGLTVEAVADVLGVSARTVEREWRTARAWLRTEIDR